MTPTQHTASPTRSRAQILRDSVEIRLAVNQAGPLIEEILKANGVWFEANWNSVFPHWLLATHGDSAIGCCQVLPSKPVGYVEFLFAKPDAPFKLRAIALRKLIIQSMATLHAYGCQYVGGVVAQKNRKFAGVLEKLNFSKSFRADLFVKRLV